MPGYTTNALPTPSTVVGPAVKALDGGPFATKEKSSTMYFLPNTTNGTRKPKLTNPPFGEHGDTWRTRESSLGRDVSTERPKFKPSRDPSVRDLARFDVQVPLLQGVFDLVGDTHA